MLVKEQKMQKNNMDLFLYISEKFVKIPEKNLKDFHFFYFFRDHLKKRRN